MISLQKLRQDYGDAIAKLAEEHDIHNVRVTGSIGAGIERPDSDIDFLVTCGEKARPYAFRKSLVKLLKTEALDVIPECSMRKHYEPIILDHAVPLFSHAPNAPISKHQKVNLDIVNMDVMLERAEKFLTYYDGEDESAKELAKGYMDQFYECYLELTQHTLDYFPHIAWQKFQDYKNLAMLNRRPAYAHELQSLVDEHFKRDVGYLKEALAILKANAPYKDDLL